jgi:acyl-CoA synthetase (AMP-forming)/AMP-acid ligase II
MFDTAQSDALHARVQAFIKAHAQGLPAPESFDALACALFRHQVQSNEPYARLARARGVDAAKVSRAADIPAVPTDAFKVARVAAFPPELERGQFRTSGTTVGARGAHPYRSTATYDMGALAFARQTLLHGLPTPLPVLVVGPSPKALPDSSLTHMIASFVRDIGLPAAEEQTYFVADGVIDLAGLDERVARTMVSSAGPVLVLGTSFAFVHLLDALGDSSFALPKGSRVMHTGGFKGQSREVAPAELRRSMATAFGIDEADVIAEYGMTELSSQFYEATRAANPAPHGTFVEPPWAQVSIVDPVTLTPLPEGQEGLIRITDLCNVDSACAIVTQDHGVRVPHGFRMLGRAPGAPPRGCSIAIDEMLGAPERLS